MNGSPWFLLYLRAKLQRDEQQQKKQQPILLSTIALETVNLLSRKFFFCYSPPNNIVMLPNFATTILGTNDWILHVSFKLDFFQKKWKINFDWNLRVRFSNSELLVDRWLKIIIWTELIFVSNPKHHVWCIYLRVARSEQHHPPKWATSLLRFLIEIISRYFGIVLELNMMHVSDKHGQRAHRTRYINISMMKRTHSTCLGLL